LSRRLRASLRSHRNIEVHQFGTGRVAYTIDVEVSAGSGIPHILNVEKQKAGLRGMRFDRISAELRTVYFLKLLLGFFILAATRAGNGNWNGAPTGIGAADTHVGHASHYVVNAESVELGTAGCDQLRVHFSHRDGPVTIVCHHKEDRQNTFLHVVCGEDVILRRAVVDIKSNRDLLVRMSVLAGVCACILRVRHDEVFEGKKRKGKKNSEQSSATTTQDRHHIPIIACAAKTNNPPLVRTRMASTIAGCISPTTYCWRWRWS